MYTIIVVDLYLADS